MTDDELIEWYECKRKRVYESFRDADESALRVMSEDPINRAGSVQSMDAYECSHCKKFHIGTTRLNQTVSRSKVLNRAKRKWRQRVIAQSKKNRKK